METRFFWRPIAWLGLAAYAAYAAYAVLGASTFLAAILVRVDFAAFAAAWSMAISCLPVVFVVRMAVFAAFGGQRWIWRSVTMHDLLLIIRATSVGSVVLVLALVVGRVVGVKAALALPVVVLLLDWGGLVLLIGGLRVGFRFLNSRDPKWCSARRVLIVGAGESGIALASQMRSSPSHGLRPIVFADDDPGKHGRIISGLRVAGPCEEIPQLVAGYSLNLVIIAMPSATPARIRSVIGLCQDSGAPFRIVPSPLELVDGDVSLQRVRDIDVADLLARPTARIDYTCCSARSEAAGCW